LTPLDADRRRPIFGYHKPLDLSTPRRETDWPRAKMPQTRTFNGEHK
jgi:hypothetical protein